MHKYTDKTKENKSLAAASTVAQKQGRGDAGFQFVDKRPEAIAQRKSKDTTDNQAVVQRVVGLEDQPDATIIQKYQAEMKGRTKQAHYTQQESIEYAQANGAVKKGAPLSPTNKALLIRLIRALRADTSTSVLAHA